MGTGILASESDLYLGVLPFKRLFSCSDPVVISNLEGFNLTVCNIQLDFLVLLPPTDAGYDVR